MFYEGYNVALSILVLNRFFAWHQSFEDHSGVRGDVIPLQLTFLLFLEREGQHLC